MSSNKQIDDFLAYLDSSFPSENGIKGQLDCFNRVLEKVKMDEFLVYLESCHPSESDLSDHLDYFERVLQANNIVTANKKLTRQLLRESIITYVHSDYIVTRDGEIELGVDQKQLMKNRCWRSLALSDTTPRTIIVDNYREYANLTEMRFSNL